VRESERRALGQSFGSDAAGYTKARPGYPDAVLDLLSPSSQTPAKELRVLEIGCGSGQATHLLVPISSELLGVDISGELLSIAKQRFSYAPHVSFLETRFEDLEVPLHHFDLVVCAQAFHWLDLTIALPKTARLLRHGGLLALFWNFFDFEAHPFLRHCREIILEHAPQFAHWPDSSLDRFSSYRAEWRSVFEASEDWSDVDTHTFDATPEQTRGEFAAWIASLSWYRALQPAASRALREALSHVESEDTLALPLRTLVLRARPVTGGRPDEPRDRSK